MRSKLFISFLFLQFFYACGNNSTDNSSESDVDAARSFIRSALNGDYKTARSLVIQDSTNLQYIEAFSSNYENRMSLDDKKGYRTASINIHGISQVDDSTTIVSYSNSYKKKSDSLKVIRQQNNWLVDLKYSFPQLDSLVK
jgi:type IV secretory pathway component VirB8